MKHKYIFHHDHYYHTLKEQIGHGVPVFHGVRQRGGGIGSILGNIAKYAIPLIKKFVFPHAKEAAVNSISDFVRGKTLKENIKNNGLNMIKGIGNGILSSVSNSSQSGKGLRIIKKKNRNSRNIAVKKKKSLKREQNKKRNKRIKIKKRNRQDIFS